MAFPFLKGKKKDGESKESKKKVLDFNDYPILEQVKPREKIVFHSDYFTIDGCYCTIMSFFHMDGANDAYPAFWGIGRIPQGLDPDVIAVSFEQTRRMSKAWVDSHSHTAEAVADKNEAEQGREGTSGTKLKARRKVEDFEQIAAELADNASYMQATFKLMLKAPTLEKLDAAVEHLERRYLDVFSTLSAAPYYGRQRQELSGLFLKNEKKIGRKYYFTSTEFAGNYNLVTHGIEDPNGEYVGKMFGDVNNSAVLFETNGYKHHVVIANEAINEKLGRTPMADYWGSKLSQSCMIHNGRVVHIILDGCDMDKLGPKFNRLTYRVDMNSGDLNPFEMFGEPGDELTVFPTQIEKMKLMLEQAFPSAQTEKAVIHGVLEEILTQYYIDNRMWYDNAQENVHRIRVINVPHEQVPKLEMFVAYLDTAHKKAVNAGAKDSERTHALNVLKNAFGGMLTSNGDLFNTITNPDVDGAKTGRRVIYDFSKLAPRGHTTLMAQLVNVIGFAISNIGRNDTIIFHGTEYIEDNVKDYISRQLERLQARGGRVVYLYNHISKALRDKDFSEFDKADYTVFGTMSPTQINEYQEALGRKLPNDLVGLITRNNARLAYIRRDFTNVVFEQDLLLGMKREREVGLL